MIPSSALFVLCGVVAAPSFERGVALGLFSADANFDYAPMIDEIHAVGATHVMLAWVWWQSHARATDIRAIPGWTATEAQLLATIQKAKRLGLRVTILPIVRLVAETHGVWRGKIQPDNEDAWWTRYESVIAHVAALAAKGGADTLSVGSELISRESMRTRWMDLIARLRLCEPTLRLIYSANWDHYEEVTFWDAVDAIGISGYFELVTQSDADGRPTVESIVDAWAPWADSLHRFSKAMGRPIVMTEIGYPSVRGGTRYPWDDTRQRALVDLEEQRRAYEAFVKVWDGSVFLSGVYIWNWFGVGGAVDAGYTPRNKPAENVLRRWFSRPRWADQLK